jgi:hypothetical protein
MKMGNCKDCRFWGRNYVGVCDTIELGWKTDNDLDAVILADAADDSGLNAKLQTGPMFGCIKFFKRRK